MIVKKIEGDCESNLDKNYIKKAKKDGKLSDFMVSDCKQMTEIMKRAFWTNAKILEYGCPKEDILFKLDSKEIKLFKEKYCLKNKKIVLYAPTFRNKNVYSNLTENFAVEKLIKCLNENFNEEYVFAIRAHPNDSQTQIFVNKNILNFSNEQDSSLVLAAADILISDYSSMIFNFLLTNKPAFIYAPDYEEYIQNERELYFNVKDCGLPFAIKFEEMLDNIKHFNYTEYIKKATKIKSFFGCFGSGDSSTKIVDYLIDNRII